MTGPGFEPLAYTTVAALTGAAASLSCRWAAREGRWWLAERRAERDRQAATQAAYDTQLAAAREERAVRDAERAAAEPAREAAARGLRPVGTPIGILNGDRR